MRYGRALGAAVALGMSAVWLPLVGGIAPAGATGSRPAAAHSVHKLSRELDFNSFRSSMRAARTMPLVRSAALTGPAPACYGDSRSIARQNQPLDPATFGAFYNCNNQDWTFEVTTTSAFSSSSFGAWAVGIDVDFTEPCNNEPEFDAFVFQENGNFYGGVAALNASLCSYSLVSSVTLTLTSTGVAITFPWSSISRDASFVWNGELDSYAQYWHNPPEQGALVPSPTYVDDVVQGGVLDSIPPSPNPPPSCSAPASAQTTEVATTTSSTRAAATLRRAGFRNVHDYGEGIVSFAGGAPAASHALSAAGMRSQISPEHYRSVQSPGVSAGGTTSPPNDPDYSSQWNLPDVGAAGAWAVTTGTNVVVADIDTGVDFDQSDLGTPQLVAGIDETTTPPTPINYGSGNTDTEGHGTAVAGVVAAATNNENEVASLGWNTSVMPVKVSDNGENIPSASIAAGIDWAVSNGAKVINLSLGGACPDSTEQAAIASAISQGVLVVAAAGNGALSPAFDPSNGEDDYYSYPAAYSLDYPSGLIAVGATGMDGTRAAYSNTGPYVSMVAPGGGWDSSADCITVLDYTNNSGTDCEAGTSFAAPQVAAAAALIWSVNPNLTASQVRELLEGTATGTGPTGYNIEYGNGMLNASTALADTPPTTAGYGTFTPLAPARILDTRTSLGGHDGPLGPHSSLKLQVTGEGGVPSSGVAAVVLNVTVTGPTAPSYLTVWPDGQSLPVSSNINFVAGETLPNLVTVKVGGAGLVDIYNSSGSTEVLADVEGYYEDGTQAEPGGTYVPTPPQRLMDTRQSGGPIGPASIRALQVAGTAYVPSGAAAVVVNVTVTQPTALSYLTVFPSGEAVPGTSNINFGKGETIPNLVTVQVPASGIIDFYNARGTVQVVADLEGYFTAAGDSSGSRFFPLVDHRILDTRENIGGIDKPLGPSSTISVQVVGAGGVLDGAVGAVMNATVTGPTAPSYLTAYPYGQPRPVASNLNFTTNETIANLLSTDLGSGKLDFFNDSGSVQVLDDVAGWYGAAGS